MKIILAYFSLVSLSACAGSYDYKAPQQEKDESQTVVSETAVTQSGCRFQTDYRKYETDPIICTPTHSVEEAYDQQAALLAYESRSNTVLDHSEKINGATHYALVGKNMAAGLLLYTRRFGTPLLIDRGGSNDLKQQLYSSLLRLSKDEQLVIQFDKAHSKFEVVGAPHLFQKSSFITIESMRSLVSDPSLSPHDREIFGRLLQAFRVLSGDSN